MKSHIIIFLLSITLAINLIIPAQTFAETPSETIFSHSTKDLDLTIHQYESNTKAYWITDFTVKNIHTIRSSFSNILYNSKPEYSYLIAKRSEAIVAINSDWNDGLIIRNGKFYDFHKEPQQETIVLYRDGTLSYYQDSNILDVNSLLEKGAWQSWTIRTKILSNTKIEKNLDQTIKSPRTVLGYFGQNHYCFFICDGLHSNIPGMTISEVATILQDYGCVDAYVLDGGANTQFIVDTNIFPNFTDTSLNSRHSQNLICLINPS